MELLLAAVPALLAVYVLAILLRVSCHFCGVEIPALGRAVFTSFLVAALSLLMAMVIQTILVGYTAGRLNPLLQFVSIVLSLLANLLITTTVYRVMLRARTSQAFSVWLAQAALFAGLALMLGCCFAGCSVL